MPRRRYVELKEFTPSAPKPKPPTYTDEEGREWDVVYLIDRGGAPAGTTPTAHDATHRGFRWTTLRRSYRFQSGDDRSLEVRTLRNQFDASRAQKTMVVALHDQRSPASQSNRARYQEQIQESYQRRRDADQSNEAGRPRE